MLPLLASYLLTLAKDPVDYVNPYIGNISHLLVPTYPTTSLPNGMLRVYPNRESFTSPVLSGLPLAVTTHRAGASLSFSPFVSTPPQPTGRYSYDAEKVHPYDYSVRLDDEGIDVAFAPAHHAGLYRFDFRQPGARTLAFGGGDLTLSNGAVSGSRDLGGARLYVYMTFSAAPEKAPTSFFAVNFPVAIQTLSARYGISFISVEQAKKNLNAEIPDFDLKKLSQAARQAWNAELGKVQIEGGEENGKVAFYTALYRTLERMVCISEDGQYYSGFDRKVHADNGVPFYTDDWSWDTFRAAHPLGIILNPAKESAKVASFVRMGQESKEGWLPTFPEVNGDAHCMNGSHFVSILWDAYSKGLRGFDLSAGYDLAKRTMLESTMAPWVRGPANAYDAFFAQNGYFPALHEGEPETISAMHRFEKRQTVPVTLAASYDSWCLAQIAKSLGKTEDAAFFNKRALSYRNLFNPATGFFHPKDASGAFIEPFDYRFSGGFGARDYYDENNGWTYRWDVQHNVGDLVHLMGGREKFIANLDSLFTEDLGQAKYEFYYQLPDQTGNVGQFTMGNEPSIHIPYLYNYAGAPWKTQKLVRSLLEQWFRNDLMGIPGDEDGGGMSAFVVFSSMGFYPVTPGTATYNIGSPIFRRVKIDLGNGRFFTVDAKGCSKDAKYIQSARLNGKPLDRPWFSHADLVAGGTLELTMADRPNKSWGAAPGSEPPSATPLP